MTGQGREAFSRQPRVDIAGPFAEPTVWLYRLTSRTTGRLLYVGITSDPGRRFAEHKRSRPWWPESDPVMTTEPYATRAEALAAEGRAIRLERPRHNRAGDPFPNRAEAGPPGSRKPGPRETGPAQHGGDATESTDWTGEGDPT